MTELTTPKPSRWRRLASNPVARKELRSRMRGRRAYIVLTIYLLLMAAFISTIYAIFVSQTTFYGSQARTAGKALFTALLFVQLFLVAFIGPAFTAGAISGEKERQTYDLLRTTLLPARTLVAGKIISALSYVLLLVIASLPLHGIALLLGGVSLAEVVASQWLVIVGSVAYAMWGMYASIRSRSTLAATVVTYTGILLVLIVFPIAFAFTAAFFDDILDPSNIGELIAAAFGYLYLTTHLPATAIISELIYIEEFSAWGFEHTVSGFTFYVPSPWLIATVVHLLTALFLYWRCVRLVQRIPKK